MFTEEHLFSIALRRCNMIGDVNFHKLVSFAGNAQKVWNGSKERWSKIAGIGKITLSDIGNSQHLEFAEKELSFCEKNNIQILLKHQKQFPFNLQNCEDAPAILYMKGKIEEHKKWISIVGTRNMTSYGKQFVEEFFELAKSSNLVSVSGLALGVDAEVHEQSINHEIPTVAVLAHGFHTLYPGKNRKLAEKILEHGGALLTEFNTSQKPDRENFIQRNRIIAGLSPATIVVETAFGGGSVSTVTYANDYNRDVYALPGRISDKYSQGCNQLIFQNKACAISSVKSLCESLGLSGNFESVGELFSSSETRRQLSDIQQTIYRVIKDNPHITLDEISEKLEIPSYKVLTVLLELELSGYLKSFSGKQYLAI